METIVKNHDLEANALIDPYLTWARDQWWYGENCGAWLYNKLRLRDANGDNNRQRLIDEVLLPEQNHRCCYCMRNITNRQDDASIEHIVPQHATTPAEINRYFTPRSGGLNSGNVCLTAEYVRRGTVGAPYPHHVAYHNFSVACRECNSGREHDDIVPLFLYAGVHDEVTYDENTGEAEWILDTAYTNPVPELPTLEKVGVNRPILKAIRAVWFYAKRNGKSPSTSKREDLIYGAVGDSLDANPSMRDDDFEAYLSLNTDEIWNLLLKYDYFGI